MPRKIPGIKDTTVLPAVWMEIGKNLLTLIEKEQKWKKERKKIFFFKGKKEEEEQDRGKKKTPATQDRTKWLASKCYRTVNI